MSEKVYMGNAMKRLILILSILLCLCSCAESPAKSEAVYANEAEACVGEFLQLLGDFDTQQAEELLLLEKDEVFFLAMDDDTTELYTWVSYDTPSLPLYLRYAAQKLSFRITSSQVEEQRATVKAYVKTVDGSTLLCNAYGGYKTACEAAALNGKPLPELAAHVDEAVLSAIHTKEPAMTERIAQFSLVKTENGWRIRSDPSLCPLFTAGIFEKADTLKGAMKDVGLEM